MRRWDPLNKLQLAVLERVDASEDLRGPENGRIRHSANALRDRGLITISRRHGRWQAEMTEAGRFYLDHGHHPDHPRHTDDGSKVEKAKQNRGTRTDERAPATTQTSRSREPTTSPKTIRTAEKRRTEAAQLVERLTADSRVVIKAPTEDDIDHWRRVVDFAKRHGLVPDGHRIEKIRQWNRDRDLHINLVRGRHPNTRRTGVEDLPLVAVPQTLRAPHTVVGRLRDDSGRLVMPKDLRRRCLLILQGLAAEADRRGHKIKDCPVREEHRYYYGYSSNGPNYSRRSGEVDVEIDSYRYTVTIQQESPQSANDEKVRRLQIELPAYRAEGRQYRWADRKTRSVEEALPAVLHELETRAKEDRQRDIDEARAKAERKVRWERAMAEAREQAIQARYADELENQAKRWRKARNLREYCAALEDLLCDGDLTVDDPAGSRAWLAWIRDYIAKIDPLRKPPSMPREPQIRDEDLKPFLKGWSPHGPEAHLNSWQRY